MLVHGGELQQAVKQYQRPLADWLDLSTGINPCGYPCVPPPARVWQRLPEEDDLNRVAADYYANDSLLAVAGSQAAIQTLPWLRRSCRVGLPVEGYAEHGYHWQRAGHTLVPLEDDQVEAHIGQLDVLLWINPNNPTGELTAAQQLLAWRQSLANRGGWLVVDEAFIDCEPSQSLTPLAGDLPGLIVLRSIGKFFGLAGIRAGFVFAEQVLLQELAERLGPWPLTGPSRWVCRQALQNRQWQQQTRTRLIQDGLRLQRLLAQTLEIDSQGCALFQSFTHPQAALMHRQLAEQGIWTRLFEFESAARLRIGLPADDPGWQRLQRGLQLAIPECSRAACSSSDQIRS